MSSAIWINFIEESDEEVMKDLYIPFNAKFLLIKNIEALSYEIVDVYQITESFPKIYTHFAVYQKKNLKLSSENNLRSMDLKGHQLNIVVSSVSSIGHWAFLIN